MFWIIYFVIEACYANSWLKFSFPVLLSLFQLQLSFAQSICIKLRTENFQNW